MNKGGMVLQSRRLIAALSWLLLAAAPALAVPPSDVHVGVFRNGVWFQDLDGNRSWLNTQDRKYSLGITGDIPMTADWNQDGRPEIGIYRADTAGAMWLVDANGNRIWDSPAGGDLKLFFGRAGDIPLPADWNNDGKIEMAVFRAGAWLVDSNGNGVFDGVAGGDQKFTFGMAGDIPVLGDWDGSGSLRIGVFRAGVWMLDLNGNHVWNATTDGQYTFGAAGDLPAVADWNNDGVSEMAYFRAGNWYVDMDGNHLWDQVAGDTQFKFGQAGDVPVVFSSLEKAVPDTGQTGNYIATFGEDSDYSINPPSYTDNGDGTVTDNVTTLVWQQANQGFDLTWDEAVNFCSANLAGLPGDGWRLPTDFELMGIANYNTTVPAIDSTVFYETLAWGYWTSSEVANAVSTKAWYVSFNDGGLYVNDKVGTNHVTCVRGHSLPANFTHSAVGDTVTDHVTGLVWQRNDDGIPRTWKQALYYCEGLTLANRSTWRLPTIKELRSIADVSRDTPALDPLFGGTGSAMYWSSTTFVEDSTTAWGVNFQYGATNINDKTLTDYVRCVR